MGRFSWHDIVLRVVSHSLRVSESSSSQLENHSGVHCVKACEVLFLWMTKPQFWQTISPCGPLGEISGPWHSGQFIWVVLGVTTFLSAL